MGLVTTKDGAEIFYKDWGNGPPVVLSHGWPLNSDSWEAQMLFLASNGFRVRRPRPPGPWPVDADLARQRDEHLRRRSRHGDRRARPARRRSWSASRPGVARSLATSVGTASGRVAKVALVSAVPPFMLQTADNPGGVPIEVFDEIRAGSLADRSQTYRDLADGPFFGNNRPGANVSQGIRDAFWLQGMQSGHRNALECIKAFSETDFRAGPRRRSTCPTLVVHGDDDQVVPVRRRRSGVGRARRRTRR